jgi:type IV secretory pathway protease TraF
MRGRPGAGCEGNPITLTDDEVFVLGDNSSLSLDGRYWTNAAEGHQLGALPGSSVTGKATAIYYPFSRWRILR